MKTGLRIGLGFLVLAALFFSLVVFFNNGSFFSIFPEILSSNNAGLFSLLLIMGLVGFIGSCLTNPQKRAILLGSPFGVVRLWVNPPAQTTGSTKPGSLSRLTALKQAAVETVLLAFAYVFMEWLFQVTKPSFMDILSLESKAQIFLISGLVVALLALLALLAIFLIDLAVARFFPAFRRYAYHIPAAGLASSLCLIMLDNFTYTVFDFGIVKTQIGTRLLYGLGFAVLFGYLLIRLAARSKPGRKDSSSRFRTIPAVILPGVSLILFGLNFQPVANKVSNLDNASSGVQTPNIIFLSTDMLNANSMSVYGYERNTTPFIRELAETSLLSANHFTQAKNSISSEASTLTGKLPLTTHLLNLPNTLTGVDMYQHLPGLLQQYGYRTVSLGVPDFVDVNKMNFQNAFDDVNCKENSTNQLTSHLSGLGYDDEIYLLTLVGERIGDRLAHIFFIKDMQNSMSLVTASGYTEQSDEEKLDCLYTYLDEAQQTGQPLFVHMHLMGTHGGTFQPTVQEFSKGESQSKTWMTDFYDDAILSYDAKVEQIVQHLKDTGLYENTILVLYTDHGYQWSTTDRLPLIIHFPEGQNAGTVTVNTQNVDIAPTILDYMGIDVPDWMDGASLLGEIDPNRLIVAVRPKIINGDAALGTKSVQIMYLAVIQCQNYYIVDPKDFSWTTGTVKGYENACPTDSLDSPEQVMEKLKEILSQRGYQDYEDW